MPHELRFCEHSSHCDRGGFPRSYPGCGQWALHVVVIETGSALTQGISSEGGRWGIVQVCRTNWTSRLLADWAAIPSGTPAMSIVNESTLPAGQSVERGSTWPVHRSSDRYRCSDVNLLDELSDVERGDTIPQDAKSLEERTPRSSRP